MSNTDQGAQPGSASARTGEDRDRLERAKRRLAATKGFYIHLFVFALVVSGLLAVNALTGGPWWVLWVLLGWGIGVLAHAIAVVGHGSKAVANWEKRKLEQFMDEER